MNNNSLLIYHNLEHTLSYPFIITEGGVLMVEKSLIYISSSEVKILGSSLTISNTARRELLNLGLADTRVLDYIRYLVALR